MLDDYPKEVVLKDGTLVTLRPLVRDDAELLVAFFQRIPPEERWYLRHDVSNAGIVRQWAQEVNYERVIPILAFSEGRIIGDATLHRRHYGSWAHRRFLLRLRQWFGELLDSHRGSTGSRRFAARALD